MAELWTPLKLKRPPVGLWTPRDAVLLSGYLYSVPNRGSLGSALDLVPVDGGNPALNPNGFGTGFPSFDFDGRQPLRAKGFSLTGDTYIFYTTARVTDPSKTNYLVAMGTENDYAWNSPTRGVWLMSDKDGNRTLTARRGSGYTETQVPGGDTLSAGVAFLAKGNQSPGKSYADKNAVRLQPPGIGDTVNFALSVLAYGGDTINFYSPHLVGSMGSGVLIDYIPTQDEDDQIYGWLAAQDNQQADLPANHPYRSSAPVVGGAAAVIVRRRMVMLVA